MWTRFKAMIGKAAIKAVYTARNIHLSEWFTGLIGWSNPVYTNLAKKVHRNPYGSRGLRIISQNMASVPLMAVKDGEPVEKDPGFMRLLERPSKRMTKRHLMEAAVNHFYLAGETFVERLAPTTGSNKGKAIAIKLHSPGNFQQFIYRDQVPPGFEMPSDETLRSVGEEDVVGFRFHTKRGKPITFNIDQMLHVKTYNPNDEDRGMPLLLGAHTSIELMESSADWNRAITKNSGRVPRFWRPSGMEPGEALQPETVASAQSDFDDKLKGRRRENLDMFLSGAWEPVETHVSPKEADWLEGTNQSSRFVASCLGLSPMLLGDIKSGSLTDAGTKAELRAAMVLTILPLLEFFLEELSLWLCPAWGEGFAISYNRDQIDILQEDQTDKYRRMGMAFKDGLVTRNEARGEIQWEDRPGEENDLVYLPLGLKPAIEPDRPPVPTGANPLTLVEDEEKLINLVIGRAS